MSMLFLLTLSVVAILSESTPSGKKELIQEKGTYSLTGSMVGARLRCEGYLCPQWVNQNYFLFDLVINNK